MGNQFFHSKGFVYLLIGMFLLLITSEGMSKTEKLILKGDKSPVVRVRKSVHVSKDQQNRFAQLLDEGKSLYHAFDYQAAIEKFIEARALAALKEQKSEILFYLSLSYYAIQGETESEDFTSAVTKRIEVDYYRELDEEICPEGYIEIYQRIKNRYGVIKITSKPAGAEVYLNNSRTPLGITPLTHGALAGKVELEIRKGKKRKKDMLVVVAGAETESPEYVLKGNSSLLYILGGVLLAGGVGAALALGGDNGKGPVSDLSYGIINVNSSPTGSQVFLDGHNTGQVTNCTLSNVSSGTHEIKLVKEGYMDRTESVSVSSGQTTTIDVVFNKYNLIITSPLKDVDWARGETLKILWDTEPSSQSHRVESAVNKYSIDLWSIRSLPSANNSGRRTRRGSTNNRLRSGVGLRSITQATQGTRTPSMRIFSPILRSPNLGNNLGSPQGLNTMRSKGLDSDPIEKVEIQSLTNVRIDLLKGGALKQNITNSTENDGYYEWIIPSLLEVGDDYSVRISSTESNDVFYDSEKFSIVNEVYEFVLQFGGYGTDEGRFYWPAGLVVDSSSNLYITDKELHRVQKFKSNGSFTTEWGSLGTRDNQFNEPMGIAVDSSNQLFVVDRRNFRVQKFKSGGAFITKWGSFGSGKGQFRYPRGIAVDSSGVIFVVDSGNFRVQKFNPSGEYIGEWGTQGSGAGQFDWSTNIVVDSSGFVYVTDSGNNRIQKFNSNGKFIRMWGTEGSGEGQFDYPRGIAMDTSGFLYVADSTNNRIQKFDSNGNFITAWGDEGIENGKFLNLHGIAVDTDGFVYAVDLNNHRIQKFKKRGSSTN